MNLYKKVIIALDTPDQEKALNLVKNLKHKVTYFKVGLELFCFAGPSIVQKIVDEGCKVFLDLKFHDIPNTAAGAISSSIRTGASMINVHASGGRKMMEEAKNAAIKLSNELKTPKPLVLAVTVLTSLNDEDLFELNIEKSTRDQVVSLAKLAKGAGLDGVVASPLEIKDIRKAVGKDFKIVTPGVRPTWAERKDQKRVMTPKKALEEGADYIVIGRPVTASKNPKAALEKIFE